jgi:hypothetical protein
MAEDEKAAAESSYVLVPRDYADIAHLANPSVIERILLRSRSEKLTYVFALITSGTSKLVLAGPKVALAAMAAEALTDFGKEVSEWIKERRLPEDFSGRQAGYQTWVELLQEIDSNPADAERLKAMKAMFLASNSVNATDGESILAYQLFQIAKGLKSGQLIVLKACYRAFHTGRPPRQFLDSRVWNSEIATALGHNLSALVEQDARVLVDCGLLTPLSSMGGVDEKNGRLTDLGVRFCKNTETYQLTAAKNADAE